MRSRCTFSVEGVNLTAMLNRLVRDCNVMLTDIDKISLKEVRFCCLYKDRLKVIAYLRQLCYNYTLKETTGAAAAFLTLIKRLGLLAGGVCFIAAALLSMFVLADIRVSGQGSDEELRQIIDTLGESGIRTSSLRRPSPAEIERLIYAKHSSLAFVQARYSGMVLYISVVKVQPLPVPADTSPRDLLSDFNGKLTKLIVYQGTPQVKAGDTVTKGQVLIGGYREAPDGTRMPVRAMGVAMGQAQLLYTHVFNPVKTEEVRTGESYTVSYIEAFGAVFPVKGSEKDIPFNSFETQQRSIYLSEGTLLPWRMVTKTYYCTELQTVKEDFDRVSKYIIEEAEDKAREKALLLGTVTGLSTAVRDGGSSGSSNGIKYIDVTVFIEKSFISSGE